MLTPWCSSYQRTVLLRPFVLRPFVLQLGRVKVLQALHAIKQPMRVGGVQQLFLKMQQDCGCCGSVQQQPQQCPNILSNCRLWAS